MCTDAGRRREGRRRMKMNKKKLKDAGAVCDDCATAAGFVRKPKAVGVWIGVCEVCGQRKPCTDLWHDWMRKEGNVK